MGLASLTRARVTIPAATAAQMRAQMPQMTERMVEAILDEVPRYRDYPDRYRQQVYQLCRLAIRLFIQIVETGNPPRNRDVDLVQRVGRNVAVQGEPLEPMLHALRIGARVGWDETRRVSRQEPPVPAEVMPALAGQVFEYIDQLSSRIAEAYAAQVGETTRAQVLNESVLFDDLLVGRAGVERVEAIGLERPRVALAMSAGGPTRDAAATLAAAVAGRMGTRFPRSVVGRRGGAMVWLLAREPMAQVLAGCAARQPVGFGVSSATEEVPLGRAVDEAVVAAGIGLELGPGKLFDYAQVYPYAALRADALALARARAALLAPLEQEPVLLETLRHYFETGRSVTRTAARVHRHRQSVIYRLRRACQLLDVQLTDAEAMFRLEAAIRAAPPG